MLLSEFVGSVLFESTANNMQVLRDTTDPIIRRKFRDSGLNEDFKAITRMRAVQEAERVQGLTFRTETRGFQHGQKDLTLVAELDGRPVGRIDYSVYGGEVSIQYIKTADDMTRRGVATQMLQRLQAEYPDTEIDWGSLTDDGAKLYGAVPRVEVDNPAIRRRLDLLPRLNAKLADLERRSEEIVAQGTHLSPEQEVEMAAVWDAHNRISDMIRKIERQTYGKRRTKTLIRQSA